MVLDERYCCRCGDDKGDAWWSAAPFIERILWLCSDCVNAVLLVWLMEHEGEIDASVARKAAEGDDTRPT